MDHALQLHPLPHKLILGKPSFNYRGYLHQRIQVLKSSCKTGLMFIPYWCLGDSADQFDWTIEGCQVLNPGRFCVMTGLIPKLLLPVRSPSNEVVIFVC